ncbi:MAG: CHRD domain-containing protein [Povalibacter sp.]
METRTWNCVASRATALALSAMLITACGGGGGQANPTPEANGSDIPRVPTAATPSISLVSPPSEPVSRNVGLSAAVIPSVNGTKQVDFYVDGSLNGTDTFGAAQPGVSMRVFSVRWDTANSSDGPHTVMARVTDGAGLTAETETKVFTLKNNVVFPIALSREQIFPEPSSAALGTGELSVNLATGVIGGDVLLTNMTASAVHIHAGFPTISGTAIIALTFDPATDRWTVPPDTTLTTANFDAQVNKLLWGQLYIDAHSAAYPEGELREHLLPQTMSLVFGTLSGTKEVPQINSEASGIVSILEDRTEQTFRINARTIGLSDITGIAVQRGPGDVTISNVLFLLRPDEDGNPAAWGYLFTAGYNEGTWFMNVPTAKHPSGEIGGLLPVIDHSTVTP